MHVASVATLAFALALAAATTAVANIDMPETAPPNADAQVAMDAIKAGTGSARSPRSRPR